MQVVDVLGHHEEAVAEVLLEPGQRPVRGVRLDRILGQGAYGIVWYVSVNNKVPEARLTHELLVQHKPATTRKSR